MKFSRNVVNMFNALKRDLPVAGSPTRFNKSQIRADLIFISIGASQFREGLRFTSNSQGFKSESINISKP